MILILNQNVHQNDIDIIINVITSHNLRYEIHSYDGESNRVKEIHIFGDTKSLSLHTFDNYNGVKKAIRITTKYRHISNKDEPSGFVANGVRINNSNLNLFPGFCALDTIDNCDALFKSLYENNISTTRAGVWKPRTSPYDYQGVGEDAVPWLLKTAHKYNIKLISTEVLKDDHVGILRDAVQDCKLDNPPEFIIQVGTRNAQNFELLKTVGTQTDFPVLYKRGFGNTLEESFNAAEYIADAGNRRILYCLRGVKSCFGAPYRNFCDFSQIPVVLSSTNLPVIIDPSHCFGTKDFNKIDNIPYVYSGMSSGIIAGATNVLIDFHPQPYTARCDSAQALDLSHIPKLQSVAHTSHLAYQDIVKVFT